MEIKVDEWISVRHRLPTREETEAGILVGHWDGRGIIARLGFYSPERKMFAVIGEEVTEPELGWKVEDVTDWTDFWAVIPEEMWGDEEQ